MEHSSAHKRRLSLIALAKQEVRLISELASEVGMRVPYAESILRRHNVPYISISKAKKQQMVSLHREGHDCVSIAKEMGLKSAEHVYRRLLQLGEKPKGPRFPYQPKQVGHRRLGRDMPRIVKMLGDMKDGKDNAFIQEKYGICRERAGQVRAYGIAAKLLEATP
jgi:hypothetical protein